MRTRAPIILPVAIGISSFPMSEPAPPYDHPDLWPLDRQRSRIHQAIGEFQMAWATVETELQFLFSAFMIIDSKNPQRYMVADEIWSVVVSFETRLKILNAIIRVNIPDKDLLNEVWSPLFNYIIVLSNKRNQVAHGGIFQQNQKILLQPFHTSHTRKNPPISIVGLEHWRGRFIELQRAIEWMALKFSLILNPRPELAKLDRAQMPDLVLRLQKQAARSRGGKKQPHQPTEA